MITKVRVRQALAIAQVEMRRAFFSKRGLWVYLLAFFPALSFIGHGIEMKVREQRWSAQGLTSAQTIDSFTKGERYDDVVKRAPNPVFEFSWHENHDEDANKDSGEKDSGEKDSDNKDSDNKASGDKSAGIKGAGDKASDTKAPGAKAPRREPDEMREVKYFDGRRAANLYFVNGVLTSRRVYLSRNLEEDRQAFAGIFQHFYLRLAIFFGCLGIFMNMFRGEMLDKTLHFWFLVPVRREVLLAGKYLAGIAASTVIFGGGALLAYAAMLWPHTGLEAHAFLAAAGWSHALWYAAAAVLGCLGYGSVFLAAGLLLRNPIIPAAVILLWESVNGFLPATLQKLSVFYYLQSLCPETALPDEGSAFLRLLLAPAAPASKTLAVLGLLAVTALVLWVASRAVRRIEINYGAE